MEYDIFSVGDNVADYYPAQKKIYAGGGAYNVAVIAKRLEKKSAYYGTFGSDQNAKFLYDSLRKEKVAYPINDIREGRNAVSIIEKENGESKVSQVDKGVYKSLKISKTNLNLIKKSKIVHSNIYSYFEDYLKKIRYRTTVSFDFSHLRSKEYIKDIIKRVNIAFFSKAKSDENPEEFLEWAHDQGADVVVFTQGKNGALMKYDDKVIRKDSLSEKVVDDLGAGDAFIAGFLTSLIDDEKDYEKALDKALKTAANNCTINGSLGVFQTREKDVTIYKDYHHEYI